MSTYRPTLDQPSPITRLASRESRERPSPPNCRGGSFPGRRQTAATPHAPPSGRAADIRTEPAGARPPHSREKVRRLRPTVYTPMAQALVPVMCPGSVPVLCRSPDRPSEMRPCSVARGHAAPTVSGRAKLARSVPIPSAAACHSAGDSACRPVYLASLREIRLCRKIDPKRRLPADWRETNRTGAVLSDYFCPPGLFLYLSLQCARKGPRPALPARRSVPEHGHSLTPALFVTVKQAIARFAAKPQRCTIWPVKQLHSL